MLRPIDILINSFAQDKLELEKLVVWFDSLDLDDKRKTIHLSRMYLEQSHPTQELLKIAIEQIPLKQTMTPIVLLKTKSLKIALNKIVELPDEEMKKAFISLVSIFKTSDTKRREIWCEGKCSHDWHNIHKLNIELTNEYLANLNGKM